MADAPESTPDEPLLRITELRKSYRTPEGETRPVLDIPAFRLARGEQVALEGESGSGKTTFLHILAGILTPDSGAVVLDGVDLTRLSGAGRDRLRGEKIGYVFQTFNLLQGYSAVENVLLAQSFGNGIDHGRARALLERVGLGERLHDRPDRLSIGQQQRVAVARALANRPALVLADEPTGNLDPRRAREALAMLREVCTEFGAALLLVSHDPAMLAAFERRLSLAELNRAGAPAEEAA